MTQPAASRWAHSYPAGLSPDMALDVWPLPSLIDRGAEHYGDAVAFVFRAASVTYRQLKQECDRAARAFAAAGIGMGDRVALLLPNTLYHPFAFFGALRIGATVVHLSPLDSPRIRAHKLSDSGARLLITTNIGGLADSAVDLLADGLVDRVIVGDDSRFGGSASTTPMPRSAGAEDWDAFLASGDASTAWPTLDPGALALLQYTGGTTGLPKAAMLTHANLSAAVSAYGLWGRADGLTEPRKERVLLVLPLFHIYALTSVMLRSLQEGQTIVMHTRFDAEAALREIEAGVTVFAGVPTMWIALCATPDFAERDLSSLRYCASGGAPLPIEVSRRLRDLAGVELLGGWGMTETSPAGTNIPRNRPDKIGTVGLPLPGIAMRIVSLDDPTRELATGMAGELAIRGPNVTSGYLNRPEETAATFADGWFLTGDIATMDEDGFVFIVDRKKDMIISGGFNVYPQLIEQAIYDHPDVEEVLVIGVADPYRGEVAKAFVKLRDGAQPLDLARLVVFLDGRVGRHELPAQLEVRDALPRTPVGKLSKLELKQQERARSAAPELEEH